MLGHGQQCTVNLAFSKTSPLVTTMGFGCINMFISSYYHDGHDGHDGPYVHDGHDGHDGHVGHDGHDSHDGHDCLDSHNDRDDGVKVYVCLVCMCVRVTHILTYHNHCKGLREEWVSGVLPFLSSSPSIYSSLSYLSSS